jgi:hypothetical protein
MVQGLKSSTMAGSPGVHRPDALHSSLPLHSLSSAQLVPAATGVCATPPLGLHESAVQGFESSTGGGAPATHAPLAEQVS